MSESPNQLTDALAGNGTFDPDKAHAIKQRMVGTFAAGARKVERYLRLYMCLCSWLFVFALFHFTHASTTKTLLFYGLLMLIFFETTILMKLWYWIMNTKLGILKEIKQLQLGQTSADDTDGAPERSKGRGSPSQGLSRRERTIWWVALIGGVALVGFVKGAGDKFWTPASDGALTAAGQVMLAADGSGVVTTQMSVVSQGMETTESFNFHAPQGSEMRFTDSRGGELPFTTSPQNGHVRYQVSLGRSVFPGHRFTYTRVQESPQSAVEEDGVWTYSVDYSYGHGSNHFAETVVLPEDAEIISADPWPAAKFVLGSRPSLRFEATRGSNEPFRYTVQYRIPTEATAPRAQ